jgi:hypothetical protein
MLAQVSIILSMFFLALTLLLALRALFAEGINGISHHRKSLYLTFSLYVLTFAFFLVSQ